MIKKIPHIKQRVYGFIDRHIASNREAPTIAEIQKQFDFRSPASVHEILVKLERQGLIKRTPNIARGIEIVKQRVTPMVGWLDR
jgi:SOS-response transcriptional repressor LexA